MIQAAEADVVGPTVAADDPDSLADEISGERQELSGVRRTWTVDAGELVAQTGDPLALAADVGLGLLRGAKESVDDIRTELRREAR